MHVVFVMFLEVWVFFSADTTTVVISHLHRKRHHCDDVGTPFHSSAVRACGFVAKYQRVWMDTRPAA